MMKAVESMKFAVINELINIYQKTYAKKSEISCV